MAYIISVRETTPVEWRYNEQHPQYGGREWQVKCPYCSQKYGIWFKKGDRTNMRQVADHDLSVAVNDHIREEHPEEVSGKLTIRYSRQWRMWIARWPSHRGMPGNSFSYASWRELIKLVTKVEPY